jgi:hypothetical protein
MNVLKMTMMMMRGRGQMWRMMWMSPFFTILADDESSALIL